MQRSQTSRKSCFGLGASKVNNTVLVRIQVDNGKYTIYQEQNGHVWADRYDQQKWLDVTNTPGSKMMLAMAYEIEELKDKLYMERGRIYADDDRGVSVSWDD